MFASQSPMFVGSGALRHGDKKSSIKVVTVQSDSEYELAFVR